MGARLRVPADPLVKVRAVFSLLGVAAIMSMIPVIALHASAPPEARIAVVASLLTLAVRRVAAVKRGRLSLRGEQLEALVIFGVCLTAGAPESLGLVYSALYLRPLFGSLHEAAAAPLI